MSKATTLLSATLALGLSAGAAQAITVDGIAELAYGAAISAQTTQTNFGDAGMGVVDYANGSEIDGVYGRIDGGVLYLTITGNLESNFNKLEIFINSRAGGENRLLGTNSNQGGFLNMADDGSGNGLTFDTGFGADYWISPTGGGGPYAMYVDYVEVGTGTGYYLGQGQAGGVGGGALLGGNGPSGGSYGVLATIDNSNTGGVGNGCGAQSGAGVTTGLEIGIPLSAIGNPTGCIDICAFVNGSSHDFLSNQVAGPLDPGTCNLGPPRAVNFSQLPGNQYVSVCDGATPARSKTWGSVKALYR
ncbi:MAG: hypothetical protein ABIS67_03540 [Candidatus Eisenbacteria bacterium]